MSDEAGQVEGAAESTSADESTGQNDTESTSADQTTETTDESTSPADAHDDEDEEPEEWRNLVKKHEKIEDEKARKAAIGKSYFEASRSAAQVARENAQLKARIAEFEAGSTPEREAKPSEPEPPPPDIQKLEKRTQALEAEKAELPKIESQLLSALRDQDDEIAILQYKLKTALEEERPAVSAELRAAKATRDRLVDRYHRDVVNRRQEIEDKLEEMGERTKLAHSRLDAEKARQTQAETQRAQFARDFPQQIDSYITHYMDELKVPADKELRHDLWESVNDSLMVAYWKMRGEDPDAVDHAALVRSHVEKYAKRMDLIGRAKFKQFSKDKADVVARLSPTLRASNGQFKEAPAPTASKAKTETEIQAELDARLQAARRAFVGRR